MLFHQLREHLILHLQLVLKLTDAALQSSALGIPLRLKGSRPILEERLLPAVKHTRLKIQLIAQIRDRNLVQQVTLEDRYLFCGAELSAAAFAGTHVCLPWESAITLAIGRGISNSR